MKYLLLISWCILVSASLSFANALEPCSKEDEINSEQLAAKAETWDQLYNLYRRYKQCDDGAIAEGFSESVSVILSQSWGESRKLLSIIQNDVGFETFILKHLDETVPEDRLESIEKLAINNCPITAKKLCEKILKRLSYIKLENLQETP